MHARVPYASNYGALTSFSKNGSGSKFEQLVFDIKTRLLGSLVFGNLANFDCYRQGFWIRHTEPAPV
jgi:hypothetical protein